MNIKASVVHKIAKNALEKYVYSIGLHLSSCFWVECQMS
jgi:hypothetical protein